MLSYLELNIPFSIQQLADHIGQAFRFFKAEGDLINAGEADADARARDLGNALAGFDNTILDKSSVHVTKYLEAVKGAEGAGDEARVAALDTLKNGILDSPYKPLVEKPHRLTLAHVMASRYLIDFLRKMNYTQVTRNADGIMVDSGSVQDFKKEFDAYLGRYEFHTRDGLVAMMYYILTEADGKPVANAKVTISNLRERKIQRNPAGHGYLDAVLQHLDDYVKDGALPEPEQLEKELDAFVKSRYGDDEDLQTALKRVTDIYQVTADIIDKNIKAITPQSGIIGLEDAMAAIRGSSLAPRAAELTSYFIGFLRHKNYTISDQQIRDKNGENVADVGEEFQEYLGAYEFHSKAEIVSLIYYTITDEVGKIVPDIKAIVEQLPEGKFQSVMKEFVRYVDRNQMVFTNQNVANVVPSIKDFVDNLYPSYGPQQKLDNVSGFYKEPAEKRINDAIGSVAEAISPHAIVFEEINKDPFAHSKFSREVAIIDGQREVKQAKLRRVVDDLTGLALLLPDTPSRDYAVLNNANSAIEQGNVKIVKRLTEEQKKEIAEKLAEKEDQKRHEKEIRALEMDRERANIAATSYDAQKAAEIANQGFKSARLIEQGKELGNQGMQEMQGGAEKKREKGKKDGDDGDNRDNGDDDDDEELTEEMNAASLRIQQFKKANEDITKFKAELVDAENVVVRFKPLLDRYTVESPLIALEDTNKQYQETKIQASEFKKKKQDARNNFTRNKTSDIDTPYAMYRDSKYLQYYIKKNVIGAISTSEPVTTIKQIDGLLKHVNVKSFSKPFANAIDKLAKNISGDTGSDAGEDTSQNAQRAVQVLTDFVNSDQLQKDIVKNAVEKLVSKKIYELDNSNANEFQEKLAEVFDQNYATNSDRSSISSELFDNLIREIPAYKRLKDEEQAVSYETDVKKNETVAIQSKLQTSIDPVELEDNKRLLLDAKEKVEAGMVIVKDTIEKVHIPKFKSMFKDTYRVVAEGSTSIANLLQKLADRTERAMEDVRKRMESIHGVIAHDEKAAAEGASSDVGVGQDGEMGERREERRGLFGFGGAVDINNPQAVYKLLVENITKLKELLDQLLSFTQRNSNSNMLIATNGEPSMIVQLYQKYIEDKNDDKKSAYEATEGLIEGVNASKLDPTDVLRVNKFDKTVFVGLTLFLRLFALTVEELLIDKKKVRTLEGALGTYLVAYSAFFIMFVLIVNIDTYRTRIIFNYINLHGGLWPVLWHLLMVWLFAFLLFVIMRNVRYIEKGKNGAATQARTSVERTRLKSRMSVISALIWVFTTILVVIS